MLSSRSRADTQAQLALLGLLVAVVTNKPMPFVAPLLASFGIERYFIGSDNVSAQKPYPAPFYVVLGYWGFMLVSCCSQAIHVMSPRC